VVCRLHWVIDVLMYLVVVTLLFQLYSSTAFTVLGIC